MDLSLLKSGRQRGGASSSSAPSSHLAGGGEHLAGVEQLELLSDESTERRYSFLDEDGERAAQWEGLEEEEGSIEDDINAWHNRDEKRSVEAIFGSKHIGLSSIPEELDEAIAGLIGGAFKFKFPYCTLFFCAFEYLRTEELIFAL